MTLTPAFGYLRTSSMASVGDDKDSDTRQMVAINACAERMGLSIIAWHYDKGITGDMSVEQRPAFAKMLEAIEDSAVRIVIVESADRFARKMLTAELGILLLVARGVTLYTGSGENLTDTDDEMRVAFRQIAMTFAQLEKTRMVKKLRGARERMSKEAGQTIEGRKGHVRGNPELVRLAHDLRGSLEDRAKRMEEMGHVTKTGKRFSASQVRRLLQVKRGAREVEHYPIGYAEPAGAVPDHLISADLL